jgi:hypothetical protein
MQEYDFRGKIIAQLSDVEASAVWSGSSNIRQKSIGSSVFQ